MLLRILAVGDVVSEAGLAYLERRLRRLQREHNVDFTVVNGENAAGIGVLPWQAQAILDAGADVVTLGNHTWGKIKIHDFLDDCRACLRPANFAPELPGNGWGIFESVNGLRVGVINLIGRVSMDPNVDNPFRKADAILEQMAGGADVVVVDFHAEATSEKLAMGWYLDGRVSALWGTHTHVPTADGQILPKGTGLITDLGMTGPANSVLGIRPQDSINKFLGGLKRRMAPVSWRARCSPLTRTQGTVWRSCVWMSGKRQGTSKPRKPRAERQRDNDKRKIQRPRPQPGQLEAGLL